ncbi:CRISPR-associated helicase/endonuclease Cas3 [Streptomyces calidiresistens]|uniref:CRISPR-associated helicase Cas3 n=1 Tax=Streptomyces calidiresistens TaxID=1485586 RepID=A0A7W3T015_9ACTN|nr:CRISPR-associated helicase Cas3' [Streptomyces calidiresistens]MBB0228370.1 CRISPR-associated helicase Cas3' [Streptomyces calidiresistens]
MNLPTGPVAPPLDRLLAKSARGGRPPETLVEHLWATLRAAEALCARTGRITAVEGPLNGTFEEAAALAALCHDAGKIPGGFQDMVCGRAKTWGERHEVLSLGFLPPLIADPALLEWVALGVLTHHRPLRDDEARGIQRLYGNDEVSDLRERFDRITPGAPTALLEWLRATAAKSSLPVGTGDVAPFAEDDLHALSRELLEKVLHRWVMGGAAPGEGLAAVLLQGAVTAADRLSSAHGDLHSHQPIGEGFRERLERGFAARGRTPREHQLRAADHSGHLLLRAPTGSGKTEAALLWAARQVRDIAEDTGGVPRLYYTLPYLASINAMTERLGDLLGDREVVGVAHSRAASHHLATAITPEDGDTARAGAAARAVARAEATRLFRETVRVGTPYQLLRSALAGPENAGVLLDSCNSVFVLDELHAYDAQRLGYVLAMAGLWKKLGGRVAVLSATLPDALADAVGESLGEAPHLIDCPDIGLPHRHRVRTRAHHLTDAPAVEEIGERLRAGEAVLVVANNVAHAIDLFETLAPLAIEANDGDPDAATLLHSRFRRGDRGAIEKRVRERFGTGLAPRRGGLLVATQVVEVSLDVDFDVLFTSAAPLEALLQRFGRVNRVAARPPADVIVHEPAWTKRRGKQDAARGEEVFADGVYEREPVTLGLDILRDHDGKPADEAEATRWLNRVYASEWGEHWRKQVEEQRESFASSFLRFNRPFDDRSGLAGRFDELFDGTEAILDTDREAYEEALGSAHRRAGRLLADDLLIPLPHWAGPTAGWDRRLGVHVVQGEYDERLGLTAVHTRGAQSSYQPGEVL